MKTKTDYRIREYDGEFTIQVKNIKDITTGCLSWKKHTTVIEWSDANRSGDAVIYFRGYIEPSCRSFDTLKDAQEMVKKMITGPIIYNV